MTCLEAFMCLAHLSDAKQFKIGNKGFLPMTHPEGLDKQILEAVNQVFPFLSFSIRNGLSDVPPCRQLL